MNAQIRFHRFGLEMNDEKLLRKIRDEHNRYLLILDAKKRAEPLIEFQELSLAEFTLEILR